MIMYFLSKKYLTLSFAYCLNFQSNSYLNNKLSLSIQRQMSGITAESLTTLKREGSYYFI